MYMQKDSCLCGSIQKFPANLLRQLMKNNAVRLIHLNLLTVHHQKPVFKSTLKKVMVFDSWFKETRCLLSGKSVASLG